MDLFFHFTIAQPGSRAAVGRG